VEESDNTEEIDIRLADKGKCAEKTAQLSAGRQIAAESISEEGIQRYGAIIKVEQIMKKTIFEEMGALMSDTGIILYLILLCWKK
jgi:hypothetical protein